MSDPELDQLHKDDSSARADGYGLRTGIPLRFIVDLQAAALEHGRARAAAQANDPDGSPWLEPWTSIGPRNAGGAVRALLQDPNAPLSFLAGTAGSGAWKTVDDGVSWRHLGGAEHALPVAALGIAPGNSSLVYIGTGEQFQRQPPRQVRGGSGLYVSTDGGETLVRFADRLTAASAPRPGDGNHYARIAVDPRETVVAGTSRITLAATRATRVGSEDLSGLLARGDIVRVGSELRVVTAVTPSTFDVDRPFSAGSGPVDYARVSRRLWVCNERGFYRFEPGRGFLDEAALSGGPGSGRSTDVRVFPDPTDTGNRLVIYVGIYSRGLWRGVLDRSTGAITWTLCVLTPAVTEPFGRVLVTVSDGPAPQAYMVVALTDTSVQDLDTTPSCIYHSVNADTGFQRRSRPEGEPERAYYMMVLEVDPTNPQRLVYGQLSVHSSADGGLTWQEVLDPDNDDLGRRGEHADQHAAVWDRRVSGRLWVAHDGGIAFTLDPIGTPVQSRPLPAAVGGPCRKNSLRRLAWTWRKRDFGILNGQLYDITVHRRFPFITSAGLQDNGTFLSYGGLSWYKVMGGDGGATAFINDPRQLLTTFFSGRPGFGVTRAQIPGGPTTWLFGGAPFPVAPTVSSAPDLGRTAAVNVQNDNAAVPNSSDWFFGAVESHPNATGYDGSVLVGRERRVFRTTDITAPNVLAAPITWTPLGPTASAGFVSAVASVPGLGSDTFWFGTSLREVFRTATTTNINPAFATPAASATDPPTLITRIAMVATGGTGFRVAVASGGRQGEVFFADLERHDGPIEWQKIDAGLPPGPVMGLVFDPGNPREVYVGTLAGVYGATDLPAFSPPASGAPALATRAAATPVTWRIYNQGMPFTSVQDLEISSETRTLRAATFGFCAFEHNLPGTPAAFRVPAVSLLIRNHVIDDGRSYANPLTTDPRQLAAAPGAALDDLHSFDIRVDAPRFIRFPEIPFGEAIDGAEFDDILSHDPPTLGDVNQVYVQISNRGHTAAAQATVHLFFARSADGASAPDLQSDFRAQFPGEPPAGTWTRIGQQSFALAAGAPFVAKFEWTPPLDVGDFVALLALVTSPQDSLELGARGDAIATLVADRRIAVRVTPTTPNPIFLRDGVDDVGTRVNVAWGGRSPDIVVLPSDPSAILASDPELNDLANPRLSDRVSGAGPNFVTVRVHNRSAGLVDAKVDIWFVPEAGLDQPSSWQPVASNINAIAIPARGSRFSDVVSWTPPAGHENDARYLLIAMATLATNLQGMPVPQRDANPEVAPALEGAADADAVALAASDRLLTFWRLVRTGVFADKVALRGLRRRAP